MPYFVLIRGSEFNAFRYLARRLGLSAGLPEWVKPTSTLSRKLKEQFPGSEVIAFSWSGAHRSSDRAVAADRLASELNRIGQQHPQIVLIGHSHGGNVALRAAYQAPFANVAIATLNTPFIHAQAPLESEIPLRMWRVGAMSLLLLCFFIGLLGFLFWPDWQAGYIVLFAGLLFVLLITRRRFVDRQAAISAKDEQKRVHEQTRGFPVRRGRRCLVVTHRWDEVLKTFNDLARWTNGALKAHRSSPDLSLNLMMMAPSFVVAVFLFAATRVLLPTIGWFTLIVAVPVLLVLVACLLVASAVMSDMGRFILAGTLRVIGLPIYSQGFSSDGFYLESVLRDTPHVEAGAIVDRYEYDAIPAPKLFALRGQPPVHIGAKEIVEILRQFFINVLRLVTVAFQVGNARLHRSPYENEKVLAKICAWV